MRFGYVLHEQAQKDYEESLAWYIERSPKAAAGFVEAVDHTLEQICTHPTRWRNTYKHYYELGLNKYPFVIIYSIEREAQLIAVWKVYHYKRSPRKKFSGLKGI